MTSATTTDENAPTPLRTYLVLATGVLAVSLAAIFIRLAQDAGLASLLIAAGRLGIAATLLTPVVLRSTVYRQQIMTLRPRDLRLIGIGGVFLAIHFASWVTSLEHTTVLISVVLVTTTPIWVALLEVFLLNARLTGAVLLGLTITLTGSIIIGLSGEAGTTDGNPLLGAVLSLIGAVAVAVYLIVGRALRPRLALLPYIWLVYGLGALILFAVLPFTGTVIIGHSGSAYFWLLMVALVPQLIGHSSLNYALAYLPATIVGIATQVEPVASAIFAAIIFGEIPGGGEILGSAIILAGVAVATLRRPTNKRKAAKAESHAARHNR